MPTYNIIRHSTTIANQNGLLIGSKTNSPLSQDGVAIAQTKAISLKSGGFVPKRVYTSQLSRTLETAQTILEELDLEIEIIQLEGLNERDFGKYDGSLIQEVLDAFDTYGPNPPTFETVDHFVDRISKCFEQIKNESNVNTLIVTHSNAVNVLKAALYEPELLHKYWLQDTPKYCEGFTYSF
jgi:broad specificity phosphatase PhoE